MSTRTVLFHIFALATTVLTFGAMIGGFGPTELMVVAVIILLLFGAKRLPEIGKSLGSGIKEFKKSITAPDDFDLPNDGGDDSDKEK